MMANIPDHPDIRKMERDGVPAAEVICCPVCGEETDEFYKNRQGEIVGCFNCITAVNPWEEVTDGDVFYGNETSYF